MNRERLSSDTFIELIPQPITVVLNFTLDFYKRFVFFLANEIVTAEALITGPFTADIRLTAFDWSLAAAVGNIELEAGFYIYLIIWVDYNFSFISQFVDVFEEVLIDDYGLNI